MGSWIEIPFGKKITKVGTYTTTNSTNINITSKYKNYNQLTIDDIFVVTKKITANTSANLGIFQSSTGYSYNNSTGILTISFGTHHFYPTEVDVYVIT